MPIKINITKNDVQELYNSLLELDLNTFKEEVEIVQAFEKYLDDASNAPEIIKIVYSEILLQSKWFSREFTLC